MKMLALVKSLATVAAEALKTAVKVSLISSGSVISVVVLPAAGCSIALLGLWLVYKNIKKDAALPKPNLDADQRQDILPSRAADITETALA